MDENNKLPAGWGDAEDDEDYGFPEEEEDSPWGAEAVPKASSAFESDEPIESETVQQNEAQGNVRSDAVSDVSANAAGTQSISSTKKSPMIAVLVGIIVVLAAGGGILGGILLSKGQDNTAEHTDETESPQTDRVSMESAAESETLQADSQAETETTVTDVPYEVYEEASIRALDAFLQTYNLGSPENPYYLDSVMYSLIDINEDGVPELLIEYPTELDDIADLYIYDGSDYKEYEGLNLIIERVCISQHLFENYAYGDGTARYIYEMDAEGNVSLKDEIVCGYDSEEYYTLNGEEISSSEYDEINSYYDSLQWETAGRYEYKRSGADMPETTEPTETLSISKPQALHEPVQMDSGLITDYPAYVDLLEKIHDIVLQGCDYNDCVQNDICIGYESAELSDIGYVLYDLNADEMPELIITKDGYMIEMYTIYAFGVQLLCQDAERYWYSLTSSGIIICEGSGGASLHCYTFERFDGGSTTTYVAGLEVSYNDDGTVQYYYDSKEITESQATELLDFTFIEFESTPITDVIATEPPAQSVPTIDAWIETREVYADFDGDGIEELTDGCDLYLCVSGDYDSYYYEFYVAEPDGSNPVLYDSGTISYSEIYLTSGSGGFSVIVGLIPYAADGIQGETVYATLVL